MKKHLICVGIGILVLGCFGNGMALEKPKNYPERPIELVLPVGPGSGGDRFARSFCEDVQKTLGVPVKYSFMPGSSGAIATSYFMDQDADGYTFLMATNSITFAMVLDRIKYDIDDFIWLAQGCHDISALHTRTDNLELQNFQDILNYCKKNPKKTLTVAGSGAMGLDHAWVELLNRRVTGLNLKFIPFNKGGERRASFQGGHTDLQSDELIDMEGLYNAGICKPVIVGYTSRVKKYADVPCTKELKIDNYVGRWRGILLKKGTPEPIVKYLNAAFKKSFESKNYQEQYLQNQIGHARSRYLGPEAFKKYMVEEKALFMDLAKDIGWVK